MAEMKKIARSISTKVVLVIICLVFPLNILAILQNYTMIDRVVDNTIDSSQNILDAYMSDVGTRMDNAKAILFNFYAQNPDFLKMKITREAGYDYQSSKYKFYYSLRNMASMTKGGDGYFYYMKFVDDMVVYDEKPGQSDRLYRKIDSFIDDEKKSGIKSGWHIYEVDSIKYLFLIVDLNDTIFGSWFNLSTLEKSFRDKVDYSDFRLAFAESESILKEKDWVHVSSETNGIVLNYDIKMAEILGRLSLYQKILQTVVFVGLALIPIMFAVFRWMLIQPLRRINEAHREIHKGNQDYRILDQANSIEYQEAYQSFNEMAGNLKKLRIESYEKELQKKKMELRNLQLQIRPHFLLNTFNLIYTLAQRKEMLAVQDIILYLSDYFRYIFRSERELELFQKELKLVKGYMKMAAIEYPQNIEIRYRIDPIIDYVRMPPLLIHNFIENSVKYGIKQGRVLHITIVGVYREQKVFFYVVDDGNGMKAQDVEYYNQLLKGERQPESLTSHIGLLNSMRRLQHFYGDGSGIEIRSETNKRTIIKVFFPYDLEVNDEPVDD